MKNKALIILSFILLECMACIKKERFEGPDYYQDSFETYTNLNDLTVARDTNWSFTQITNSANQLTVDSTRSVTGKRALKFFAKKSNSELVSKCSISKQNMAFWENETVHLSAWYYLEGNNELNWMFLMDLEEQAAIGAGPGIRLVLVDNKIRMEYKFNEKDVIQTEGNETLFPRNSWVKLDWYIKLSRKDKGSVTVLQDGKTIIQKNNITTLPHDILYFQQGTKGMYSSCEIGVTANSYSSDVTLWIDDIQFEKE